MCLGALENMVGSAGSHPHFVTDMLELVREHKAAHSDLQRQGNVLEN